MGQYPTPDHRLALHAYTGLMRASEAVTRRTHGHLRDSGLTVSQFAVLEALLHVGPCPQATLGRKILRSANNVTTVIDNLERRGLVERKPDETDRRVKRVHLTDEGRGTIEGLFPQHAAALSEDLSVLAPEELRALAKLCRRLVRRHDPGQAESERHHDHRS